MTLVTWPGSNSRSALSTSAATLLASSRRIPSGARKCMSISPDLIPGKKSCPSHGINSVTEAIAAAKNARINPPRHRLGQEISVAFAKPLESPLEAALEPAENAFGLGTPLCLRNLRAQQKCRHSRHECARQDEGGDHREYDGFGERQEEVAGDPRELEQRQPD